MKFSAFNVISAVQVPTAYVQGGRRRRASKTATSLKSGYFAAIISCSGKTIADRYIHAAYHNKHYDKLFIGVNVDDLE